MKTKFQRICQMGYIFSLKYLEQIKSFDDEGLNKIIQKYSRN